MRLATGLPVNPIKLVIAGLSLVLFSCQGPAGEKGSSCSTKDNGDGTITISCTDGTRVTVANGRDGTNGTNGDGGAAGTSCTLETSNDGGRVLACSDGTMTDIPTATACSLIGRPDGGRAVSCNDGTVIEIVNGTNGVNGSTVLTRWDNLPGVVLAITGVAGGTGPNGNVRPGDTVSVTFTVKRKNGTNVSLKELSSGAIYLSGPTSNYQRVIASQSDLLTRAVDNGGGSWAYTFAAPIPATFLAPLNDSPSFDAGSGELTGQPLLDGTYTVAMQAYQNFTIEGVSYRDTGNATSDFLMGAATVLVKREVVGEANCEQCHTQLRAHGGSRNDLSVCVTCHTAGAEDRNVATVEGGTPGVTIEFAVMVHKIHNAAHLPSVVGVGHNATGAPDYTLVSKPYKIVGYNNAVTDFSEVAFPVFPSAYAAFLFDTAGTTYTGAAGNGFMPRDTGWAALAPAAKLKSDKVRTGTVACSKCHGVPNNLDGGVAPSQGNRFETAISRKTCGSCHDTIDFSAPGSTGGHFQMLNDDTCAICHGPGALAPVRDAHRHPYENPAFNTGVNLNLTGLTPGSGPGGKFVAGDPFEVTFSVTNDADAGIPVMSLTRLQIIVVGPTSNRQIILPNTNPFDFAFRKASPFTGNGTITGLAVAGTAVEQVIGVVFTSATTFDVRGSVSAPLTGQVPGSAVTFNGVTFTVTAGTTPFAVDDRWYLEVVPAAASYTIKVPLDVSFERLGQSTGAADVFTVGNLPLTWGRQVVMERTALVGSAGVLSAASAELQRYVALDAASNAGLAVGDRVGLDLGLATEEYAQIGRIQTTDDVTGADLGAADRVYFTTPLRYAHGLGGAVQEVTLTTRREGSAYSVSSAANGQLTTVAGAFTAGNPVVVSYRTAGRFGWKRSPTDTSQNLFPAPIADSAEIDESWGDWKGLPLLDGTYTVGMWANKDFTLTPDATLTATQSWDTFTNDNTTYRMMAKPATRDFLFGAATTLEKRAVISSGANCNVCHTDLAAHGFGRRGLETCLLCHNAPGAEDGPKFTYASWYVRPTPGVTVDFRTLAHRIHAGKELSQPYETNGVFLGTPYPVSYNKVGFPSFVGGVAECTKCHGPGNTAWQEPAPRAHPLAPVPVRTWAAACGSCHDSATAQTHFFLQTANGAESCAVCHGKDRENSVELSHKAR